MLKRIIACIVVCCIAVSGTVGTFASNLTDIKNEIIESGESQTHSNSDTAENPEAQAGTEIETKAENNSETDNETETGTDSGIEFVGSTLPEFEPRNYYYSLFEQVVDLYVKEHLYEFTREEVIEKFIYDMIDKQPVYFDFMLNTLLGTMDKYSTLHKRDSGFMSVDSPNAGYGIVVTDDGESVFIKKVLRGSNAEKAGIKAGDKIVSVMGIDVTKLTWSAVSVLLKSPHIFVSQRLENGKFDNYNPEIDFTVERDGEQITVKMTRGVMINDELTLNYFEEEQVAYIGISSFLNETLATDFYDLLLQVKKDGYKKLIIDLRDNGGGSLDLVIAMVEHFVDSGETMCYFNNRKLEKPEPVISNTSKMVFDKISVLINENTASAAELMANILKNSAGAELVGKTSYGKAIGQSVYNLMSGDYITITTYEILDIYGKSYNGIGLVPELMIDNVEVMYTLPPLMIFNHTNYKEIEEGVYHDACMALEQRLEVMGLIRSSEVDGIWDIDTQNAILILQRSYNMFSTDGHLDDMTVTLITNIINDYKNDTYYEDSQLDVALIYHSSKSQAERLIKEKIRYAEKQQALIKEREARINAEIEAAEAKAKAEAEAKQETSGEAQTETEVSVNQ